MDPPVFSLDHRSPFGERSDGNYSVSHVKQQFVYMGPESSKLRDDHVVVVVNPSGSVVTERLMKPMIRVGPSKDSDVVNSVYRFVMPLGRGYSQLIQKVTHVEMGPDGIAKVTAQGTSFSPYSGIWSLEVDTTRDYLVRRAEFSMNGKAPEKIISASEAAGITSGKIPLYKQGSHANPSEEDVIDDEIRVSLDDYTNASNPGLITAVRSAVENITEGTTLMDYTRKDKNGAPFVIRGIKVP
jgi:hypothetical protein